MAANAAFIRAATGAELSDAEVAALADWYAPLAKGVAGFPEAELIRVEPPLLSTAGPAERA